MKISLFIGLITIASITFWIGDLRSAEFNMGLKQDPQKVPSKTQLTKFEGEVIDTVLHKPISGAVIKLYMRSLESDWINGPMEREIELDSFLTRNNGKYVLKANLPNKGSCSIKAERVGYTPYPYIKRVMYENGTSFKKEEISLIKTTGGGDYYKEFAVSIMKKANQSDSRLNAIQRQWEYLGAINLPPSKKMILAHELNEIAPKTIENIFQISEYLDQEIKTADIEEAEKIFKSAVANNKVSNSNKEIRNEKLAENNTIVLDLILYATWQPNRKITDFYQSRQLRNEFQVAWPNVKIPKNFVDYAWDPPRTPNIDTKGRI